MNLESGKALIKSKVFWFTLVFILVKVASVFGYVDFRPDEKLEEVLEAVFGLLIIYWRIGTTKPITKLY